MRDRFIVGRQPIFDEKLAVIGYKLMVAANQPTEIAKDAIVSDNLDIDLPRLFGDKPVFIRADAAQLFADYHLTLPPEQAVIEVPADVDLNGDMLETCREMVKAGYELAVDAGTKHYVPDDLLELASYVKFDVGFISREKVRESVQNCRARQARMVAKNVDTLHRAETFQGLGFDLFEGYLMSRPVVRVDEALTPSRLTCLQLIETVNHPDTTASDIERIVESEPGLSYRLLHVSSIGTAGGMRRPVQSISEAVVLLGRDRMYNWLILMLISDANRGTPEQLLIAMTRARMCRLMASSLDPRAEDAAYTAGLISALDLLLGAHLNQILENLAITTELRMAVLSHTGPLGLILGDVLDWERAAQEQSLNCGLDHATTEKHYLNALAWATEMCAPLEDVSQHPAGV